MTDWRKVQTRLRDAGRYAGKIDGDFGPMSYTALLSHVAGRAVDPAYGKAAAHHLSTYGVDGTVKRLAGFIGQCSVESGGFRYTREKWGPTADQARYDLPGNTLGNRPGDGFLLRGAGWIEVTGRRNLTIIGATLNLDLIGNPKLLDDIDVGCLISLEWWKMNHMNDVADNRDVLAISRAVNRGSPDSKKMPYAADERAARTAQALGVLS